MDEWKEDITEWSDSSRRALIDFNTFPGRDAEKERLYQEQLAEVLSAENSSMRDIHPGKDAPVLSGKDGSICCGWQHWGFHGFEGKKLIFNARCESALEKPMFRDSILHRRIVIPASWFYECWSGKRSMSS